MSLSANNVVVLSGTDLKPSESNARKLVEFLGANVTAVSLSAKASIGSIQRLVPPCAALIVHANTLVDLSEVPGVKADRLLSLVNAAAKIFIFGFEATEHHAAILSALSSGGVVGVEPLPISGSAFVVSGAHRGLCGQLTGLTVRSTDRSRDACFVEGKPREEQAVLIQAGNRPYFVRICHGASDLFFVASNQIGDLDQKICGDAGLLPWFSRIVPLMIFLKSALGDQIWHTDHSQACFIVDDPLLKTRYGFLKYSQLLETMGDQGFCTSIAFIPWNYQRSQKRTIKLFSNAPTYLSLCIHGCDHTRGEFAATDYELLRNKAQLAIRRMEAHSELSGLSFDDVMVFPQGLFSTEAIKALKACGYLAAVNTDPCPSNAPESLTLGELLEPAVTKYEEFPLFVRHYPEDPAEFALDLFLGKPALVVEHHGYFRNGYNELATFVKRMNALDELLEWNNLATITSRACLKRSTLQGDVYVRFYTNRFLLTNNGIQSETYVLFRQWNSQDPLPIVTVSGREWMRERKDGGLKLTVSLGPGQSADIRIIQQSPRKSTSVSWKPTRAHNTRVLIRRVLSEFRDDHIQTNKFLSGLLSSTHKLLARKSSVSIS